MAKVAARSPAAAADIRSGNVVKVVDGRTIIGRCEFEFSLVDHKAGDVLHMELLRGGQPVEASLKLGARPKPDGAVLLREKFGLAAEPLTKAMANAALLRVDRGVRITGVASGPPYNRIKSPPLPGDILARVNDMRPRDMDHLGMLLDRLKVGDPIHFVFLRFNTKDRVATRIEHDAHSFQARRKLGIGDRDSPPLTVSPSLPCRLAPHLFLVFLLCRMFRV